MRCHPVPQPHSIPCPDSDVLCSFTEPFWGVNVEENYLFLFFCGDIFCWGVLWSMAGHSQRGPGGATGEGQGCGAEDRAAEVAVVASSHADWGCHGATAFPSKLEFSGAGIAAAETDWLSIQPHKHQCCPNWWRSARVKRNHVERRAVRMLWGGTTIKNKFKRRNRSHYGENVGSWGSESWSDWKYHFPIVESTWFAHFFSSAGSSCSSSVPQKGWSRINKGSEKGSKDEWRYRAPHPLLCETLNRIMAPEAGEETPGEGREGLLVCGASWDNE